MKRTNYMVAMMLFTALFMSCNKKAQANTPKEFTPADVPDYLDVGFSSMGFSWLKGYDMATLPENLVIPNGIEYIDEKAFANCKILESVVIPESLTDIRDGAFYDKGVREPQCFATGNGVGSSPKEFGFDASRCSSVYRDDAKHVTPVNVTVRVWLRDQ